MIKVAGIWELGWNTPIKEVELWEYPLRDYGVEQFHMAPVTGIQSSSVVEHADISTFLESERELGRTIVFVDEKGENELSTFTHPVNATYVLGKASLSAMVAYGTKRDSSVRIATSRNLATLWPHQAIVLVLHDRMLKG